MTEQLSISCRALMERHASWHRGRSRLVSPWRLVKLDGKMLDCPNSNDMSLFKKKKQENDIFWKRLVYLFRIYNHDMS